MPDITPRLGLRRPLLTDPFLTSDFQFNYDQLEKYPGVQPVLSTSRPSGWGTAQNGMLIQETDTGRLLRWTGAAFALVEQYPRIYKGSYETTGSGAVLNAGQNVTYALTGLNLTPPRACNIFFQITAKFVQDTGTSQWADCIPWVGGSNTVGGVSVGLTATVRFGDSGTGAAGKASQFVTIYGSFAAAKDTAYQIQQRVEVANITANSLTFTHARGMAWLAE